MNRQDRILLDTQVRQLDEMILNMTRMRSVLVRRASRIVSETTTIRVRRVRRPLTETEQAAARSEADYVEATARLDAELAQAEAARLEERVVRTVEIVAPRPVEPVRPRQTPLEFLQQRRERRELRQQEEARKQRERLLEMKNITKILKKSEFESVLPDVCGICLENHKMKETVLCSCNHVFGEECYNRWKNNCVNNGKFVSCPTCRVEVTQITTYKQRAEYVRKVKEVKEVSEVPVQEVPIQDVVTV